MAFQKEWNDVHTYTEHTLTLKTNNKMDTALFLAADLSSSANQIA